jgi:hypothetical protein
MGFLTSTVATPKGGPRQTLEACLRIPQSLQKPTKQSYLKCSRADSPREIQTPCEGMLASLDPSNCAGIRTTTKSPRWRPTLSRFTTEPKVLPISRVATRVNKARGKPKILTQTRMDESSTKPESPSASYTAIGTMAFP